VRGWRRAIAATLRMLAAIALLRAGAYLAYRVLRVLHYYAEAEAIRAAGKFGVAAVKRERERRLA
jgi:hypothetical protein